MRLLGLMLLLTGVIQHGTVRAAQQDFCGYVNGVGGSRLPDSIAAHYPNGVEIELRLDKANPHGLFYISSKDQAGIIGQMITSAWINQKHICISTDDSGMGISYVGIVQN